MKATSPRTVLITGSSSGIGRATALLFQENGWNVVATMRSPGKETELNRLERVICPALDVTRPDTIRSAIGEAISRFGGVDVVVNNAGYGMVGPFEGATREQIERQYQTNVFGVMDVIRAILPHFRARKSGVIVNITSVAGRVALPLYGVYNSTKFALEGFSEALAYELKDLGIRVKLVEPGAIKTDFSGRSADPTLETSPEEYKRFARVAMANIMGMADSGTPEMVARVIHQAAIDGSGRLRYVAGADGRALLALRSLIPHSVFTFAVRKTVLKAPKGPAATAR